MDECKVLFLRTRTVTTALSREIISAVCHISTGHAQVPGLQKLVGRRFSEYRYRLKLELETQAKRLFETNGYEQIIIFTTSTFLTRFY